MAVLDARHGELGLAAQLGAQLASHVVRVAVLQRRVAREQRARWVGEAAELVSDGARGRGALKQRQQQRECPHRPLVLTLR